MFPGRMLEVPAGNQPGFQPDTQIALAGPHLGPARDGALADLDANVSSR
jgi:hypothetical protein